MEEMIAELSRKQRMLEAVFGKTSAKEIKEFAKDDEFKCLKVWRNEIYQNDPPLSQLLDRLIAVQMYAKAALGYGNDNELSKSMNALKQILAYAVHFMATIRLKIQLNNEKKEEQKDGKSFWTELANFYDEFEFEKIGKKCHQKRECFGKNGSENEDNNKKQRDERFFRFLTKAFETEWDGGDAFPNWQNNADNDARRKKRRKRKTKGGIFFGIGLAICAFVVAVFIWSQFCRGSTSPNAAAAAAQETELAIMPGGQMAPNQRLVEDAWAAYLLGLQENPIENNTADDCPICLSPINNSSTAVNCAICTDQSGAAGHAFIPHRACGRTFHHGCIHPWLRNATPTCPTCRANFFGEPNGK